MAANRRTSELDIICIPDAVWKAPLWTNRQQIMSRIPRLFSRARVLYVEPPRFLVSYLRWRLSGTTDANLSGFGYRCVPVQDRLWVLQSAFPVPNRVGRNYMFGLLKRWIMYLIGICQEQLGFRRPVLWSYSPFTVKYIGHLSERLVCYDCVDDGKTAILCPVGDAEAFADAIIQLHQDRAWLQKDGPSSSRDGAQPVQYGARGSRLCPGAEHSGGRSTSSTVAITLEGVSRATAVLS